MQLPLDEVAAILGASCRAPERIAQGYSIDSRTLQPGELFFAIRGPRLDGHEFVRSALERGASGAVVERNFAQTAGPALAERLLPVPDTAQALQQLAQAIRKKWGKRVVAVTGSTGKTTTKELIAALLSAYFSTHKSPGNLNNAFGLPLALLALESRHEVAVVELAMSAPGEVRRLAQIAAPEIGVVTNVAPVHLEFFDSVDSIARAKRELIENLAAPATAVLNYDDQRVRRFADRFAGRVVTFGFEPGAEVRGTTLRLMPQGGHRFRVTGAGLDAEFELRLPGRYNVENALAALATASVFQVPVQALRLALATFQNLHQRGEILTLPGGITLLNDSYNSNPLAMERMLETLAAWPGAKRRIVVAGEMLELGPKSAALHREVGRTAAKCGVDWLLGVRGDARFFLEGAAEAGLPRERMRFFAAAQEAGEYCQALVEAGDAVLVKGSRGVRLETVIGLLESRFGRLPEPPADAGRKS